MGTAQLLALTKAMREDAGLTRLLDRLPRLEAAEAPRPSGG